MSTKRHVCFDTVGGNAYSRCLHSASNVESLASRQVTALDYPNELMTRAARLLVHAALLLSLTRLHSLNPGVRPDTIQVFLPKAACVMRKVIKE